MKLTEPIIQYVGLNELSPEEQELVKELSVLYQDKIQKEMQIPTSITLHVKLYNNEGKRKRYSVNVKTVAASQTFEENNASDWDLARTLHNAFKKIERLIQHKLHTDGQNKNPDNVKKLNK